MEGNFNIITTEDFKFKRVQEELCLSDQDVEDHKGDARAIWEKTYTKFKEANESEYSGRRWFWELVQNAVDSLVSLENTVDIEVRIYETNGIKTLEFSHNGGIFKSGKNIDDIDDFENFIRPGSSKPIGKSEKGGRFGTGFLSTHCLSPKIKVAGICSTSDKNLFWNEIILDRSEIVSENPLSVRISKLKITKQLVDYKDNRRQSVHNIEGKPSAKFTYLGPISEKNLYDGLKEIELSLHYVNAFNPQLKTVTIIENEKTRRYTNLYKVNDLKGNSIYGTKLEIAGQSDIVTYLIKKETDRFDLAWAVEYDQNGNIIFKDEGRTYTDTFSDTKASIFCRYPLIGSGLFKFPVIINSKEFRPEEKRNGINLIEEDTTNKEILNLAIKAFQEFLIDNKSIEHQFNIVDIFIKKGVDLLPNWVDKVWYSDIISRLKLIILEHAQLKVSASRTICLGKAKIAYLSREDFDDQTLMKLHKVIKELHPQITPIESEYLAWFNQIDFSIMPSLKYDLKDLLEDVQKFQTLDALPKEISNPIKWLKRIISIVREIDVDLLDKYAILPNQFGSFKRKGDDLFLNEDIILKQKDGKRSVLLNCHSLILNKDFESLLLHYEFVDFQDILPNGKSKSEKMLIKIIDDAIEVSEDRRNLNFVKALQYLFNWLDEPVNIGLIKEFRYLNGNKPDLYFNTFTDLERDLSLTIAQSGKLSSLSNLAKTTLTNDDINSMVEIGNSGVDINKMSELAILSKMAGIEKILESARDLAREEEERVFKQEIGESIEEILNEVFKKEFPYFDAELKRAKEYDILITNKLKPSNRYFIELKSIKDENPEPIKMGIYQARWAMENPENYALLLIKRPPKSIITEEYLRSNITCDCQIGKDISEEVGKSIIVDEIVSSMGSIKLEIKDPTMKVHIHQDFINRLGKDFDELKMNINKAIR